MIIIFKRPISQKFENHCHNFRIYSWVHVYLHIIISSPGAEGSSELLS